MALIQRQRVVWSGFQGAPGLSTFYFTDAAAAQSALHAFLANVISACPPDVHMHMEPGGDVLDDTNGALRASWAGTLQTDLVGTAAVGPYSAPSGALLRWETATIVAGSRLRGRTYLVPIGNESYEANGTIAPATLTGLSGACSTFVGAVTPGFLVWQRPRAFRAAYVDGRGIPHKSLSARNGSSAVVITSSVPDKAVVLRSRRD